MTATNLTERDIAARTLLVLFNQGVTKRTPERFRDALRALNLTHGDLVRADQTMPYGWTPTGESTPTPASLAKRGKYKATAGTKVCGSDLCDEPVLPERTNSRFCSDTCRDDQDERDAELARTGRSGITRRCTQCGVYKPVEDFRLTPNGLDRRGGRRWKLKSFCVPCERGYQRARYVNLHVEADLNRIGLTFLAGDDEVGLACVCCGKSIQPGQRVVGDVSLEHWACRHPELPVVGEGGPEVSCGDDTAAESRPPPASTARVAVERGLVRPDDA